MSSAKCCSFRLGLNVLKQGDNCPVLLIEYQYACLTMYKKENTKNT